MIDKITQKGKEFIHGTEFLHPNDMNSVKSNSISLKYQRFTTSEFIEIWIRFEFLEKQNHSSVFCLENSINRFIKLFAKDRSAIWEDFIRKDDLNYMKISKILNKSAT